MILFQHNVETMLWQRMAQSEKSAVRKLAYSIEARKMSRYESRALAKISTRDRGL